MLTATTVLLTSLLPQGTPKPDLAPIETHKGTLLVKAARIFVDKERVVENDAILIRDGKVLYVGAEIPADAKKNATVISFPKGTVVPGFINPHSSLGHGDALAERIDTFTPELMASEAFDPFAPSVQACARAGVTTVGLAPSSFNAFAGQGAAIHTGRIGQVMVDSTYLKMSMLDASFDQNRFPTSRMGAADLIRTTFAESRSALGPTDNRLKILHEVASGGRLLAFRVKTEAEIEAVLDLAEELSLKPLLVGCEEGHKCADRIAKLCSGVVLAPLSFGSSKHRLGMPATLEKLGVPFSFMAERPEDLRVSAALAVRYGASPKASLAALTETAARHTLAQDRVGTLFEGKSADFCVFRGDPLDLTSRLLQVYIAGVAVAEPTAAKTPAK